MENTLINTDFQYRMDFHYRDHTEGSDYASTSESYARTKVAGQLKAARKAGKKVQMICRGGFWQVDRGHYWAISLIPPVR